MIPDFLLLPDNSPSLVDLRRTDLAELRLHVGHRYGMAVSVRSEPSLLRLIAHGMLERRADGWTYATQHGREVAKANASCRDGTETQQPPKPSSGPRLPGAV